MPKIIILPHVEICPQGEVIDNIAKNMQTTVEYIEEAKEETKKAVVFQGKARRVRMTFFFIFGFKFDFYFFFNFVAAQRQSFKIVIN